MNDVQVTGQPRTLLLVDDEENILAALRRLLRRDGYRIFTANGGAAGLEILKTEEVDVIVSDQRMPGMTGTEFLREARKIYPKTMRIVLSGYTELESITNAINEGAIYKFLTKPWDDEQLRANIEEAFRHKALEDSNRNLENQLRQANQELAEANIRLQALLTNQERRLQQGETSLDVAQEIMQHVPLAVIGVSDDGLVVFANIAAEQLLGGALVGRFADESLPPGFVDLLAGEEEQEGTFDHREQRCHVARHNLHGRSHGRLLVVRSPLLCATRCIHELRS